MPEFDARELYDALSRQHSTGIVREFAAALGRSLRCEDSDMDEGKGKTDMLREMLIAAVEQRERGEQCPRPTIAA